MSPISMLRFRTTHVDYNARNAAPLQHRHGLIQWFDPLVRRYPIQRNYPSGQQREFLWVLNIGGVDIICF